MLLKKAGACSRPHSLVFQLTNATFMCHRRHHRPGRPTDTSTAVATPRSGFCFDSFELALKTTEEGWGRHSLVFELNNATFMCHRRSQSTMTTDWQQGPRWLPPDQDFASILLSYIALKTTEGGWGPIYPSLVFQLNNAIFVCRRQDCQRDRRQHPRQCLLYDTLRMTTSLRLALVLMVL